MVAALLPLLGLGVGVWLALGGVQQIPQQLRQVIVPGKATITLDSAGTYTVFHEDPTVAGGRVYSTGPVTGLEVAVFGPGGEPLPLAPPGGTVEYTLAGRTGRSMLSFDAPTPGDYTIAAGYGGGDGPETVLAVGRGVGGALAKAVLAGIFLPLVGGALGLVVGILTFVRRRSRA